MKKLLSIAFWLSYSTFVLSAQNVSIIEEILRLTTFTRYELREISPHFPYHVEENEVAISSLQEWSKNYPLEFNNFIQHPKYQNNKFAWYTFGIEIEEEIVDEFLNDDILRWINIHHLSDSEVKAAAPNFPDIPNTGSIREDAVRFNHQKVLWKELFPTEFDNLMALVYQQNNVTPNTEPNFMSYRPTTSKPIWEEKEGNHRLVYEMKLQHWYYMFDQETYKLIYGTPPALPTNYKSMEEYILYNTKNDN